MIQENEIMALARFLHKPINRDEAKRIAGEIFGKSKTFREGQTGSWKTHLTAEHRRALKAMPGFNTLLIKMGYEKDSQW